MKWLIKFCFLNQLFSGVGEREGKVNYNKDLPCFPRHTALLVKFAICHPCIRKTKTVLDSGFHAVDSGFQILDSSLCQRNLDSGFQSLVGLGTLSCIPDSTKAQDSRL